MNLFFQTDFFIQSYSGFTKISELCAKMGPRGWEELSFCMNRYMESIVKGLGNYGGDIIKFVGDAMIVVWPRDEANPEDDLSSVARKAIKASYYLLINSCSELLIYKLS